MASDYLLEIDGIKGESTDAKHKDAIHIESFSWGTTQSGSAAHGSGGGAGKAVFQDFHFTTKISAASPQLFLKCASGEHIKKAVLTVRKAGGDQQEYYQVMLSDLLVSTYQQGAGGGEDTDPMDAFSLNFTKIELEYRLQNRDGQVDGAVKVGWDVQRNVKL